MQELTKKQIDILFEYTESFNIPFKDVQIEVVDHLATALEENSTNTDEESFGKILFEYTKTLPHNFFFNLIEEKKKYLELEWWSRFSKALKKSFKPPVILLWFAALILFYFLLKTGHETALALIGFSYFWVMPFFVLAKAHRDVKDQDENKFLFLKMYASTTDKIIIFLCLIPLGITNIFIRDLISNVEMFYTFLFAFQTVVFYLVAFSLPNNLANDIEKKYAHLNIKMA